MQYINIGEHIVKIEIMQMHNTYIDIEVRNKA